MPNPESIESLFANSLISNDKPVVTNKDIKDSTTKKSSIEDIFSASLHQTEGSGISTRTQVSSEDISKYDFQPRTDISLQDYAAKEQTAGEAAFNDVTVGLSNIGTNLVRDAGFIIGGTNALVKALNPYADAKVSDITEQGLVTWADDVSKAVGVALPHYLTEDQQNNPAALRNIIGSGAGAFWGNTMTRQVVPFFASMWLEGMGAGKLIASAGKAAKIAEIAKAGGEFAVEGTKWAKNINWASKQTSELIASYGEAMFEAKDKHDIIYQDAIERGLSEVQAESLATNAFEKDFLLNLAVLKLTAWEFDGLYRGANKARKPIKDMLTDFSKLSKTEKALKIGEKILEHGKNMGKEAGEELFQGGVGTALEEQAKGGEDEMTWDKTLGNALSETINRVGTDEGKIEILSSMILSGGATVGQNILHKESERENKAFIRKQYESSISGAARDITDITTEATDKSGNTVKMLNEKGKQLIREAKTFQDFETLKVAALATDDTQLYNHVRDLQFAKFTYGHFEAGLAESLDDKIDALGERSAEELQKEGGQFIEDTEGNTKLTPKQYSAKLKQKAKEYEQIYTTIEERFGEQNPSIREAMFTNAVMQKKVKDDLLRAGTAVGESFFEYVDKNKEKFTHIVKDVKTEKTPEEIHKSLITKRDALEKKEDIESQTEASKLSMIIADYESLKEMSTDGDIGGYITNLRKLQNNISNKKFFTRLKEDFDYLTNERHSRRVSEKKAFEAEQKKAEAVKKVVTPKDVTTIPEVVVNDTVNEDPEEINTQTITKDYPKGGRAQTELKTESGLDDDTKPSRNRFFRYIEKNNLKGNKLLVVTRNNNLKLYEELVALDEDATAYEAKHLKETGTPYQGIYTVIVDKSGTPIKADEKGQISDKGELVFSTLTTIERIENEEISVKDKKAAIARLTALRESLLASKSNAYLTIVSKSKGHAEFEKTVEGVRQSKPIVGRLGDTVNSVDLQLPTQSVIGQKGKMELKNGQTGYVGHLYGFDENGRAVDLIPRTLLDAEIEYVFDLVLQRMGLIENQTGDVSRELEKIIYFGVPKTGATASTLGVAKGTNNLTLGEQTLTPEQLSTPEGQSALKSFLKTKRVNVNTKYGFEDGFVDAAGVRHESYKHYLLSGETPMFGTDLKPRTGVQFRNQYLIYDPNPKFDTVTITKEDKNAELIPEEVDMQNLLERFKETGEDDLIEPSELNRLTSQVATSEPISEEEINWFNKTFPNIPIEKVQGLIDNKALGRFLSAGRVLLSTEATVGTLRHEAFHTVTQLYLTQRELTLLYAETKDRLKVKTDLEAEEALAEDFIDYGTTKKVLGKAALRNTLFKKIWDFIRDLLNLKANSIEDIYRRLDKGFYTNKPIVGIRQFSSLNRALPNQSEAFTKDLLDGVDAIFFTTLFNNNFTPSKLRETEGLAPAIMKRVYNRIGKLKNIALDVYTANKKNEAAYQAIKNYTYILNNWDNVQEAWKLRAASIGIEVKIEEDSDPNVELSVNEEENTTQRSGEAYQEANLVSTKSNMSEQSKMLIRSLKQKNSDGTDKLNSLGLPTVVNFNKTYNFLLRQLSGLITYEEIYKKIETLSENKPEFKDLLSRLGKISSTSTVEQFLFQQQFRQDFSKNQSTSFKTVLKADGEIYIVDANKENTTDRVKESWKNNIRNKAKQNKEGKLIISIEVAKTGSNVEFLSNIGWNLSPETVNYIKTEQPEFFNSSVTSIRNYIIENEGDVTEIFDSKQKTKKDSDETSNINRIAELESDLNPEAAEMSFMSTENKTVYSIGINNALSIIKNIINNSETKEELFARLPHLNTLSTEGSLWLSELFDSEGNKKKDRQIDLNLHDGIKTDSEVLGKNKFASATRKITAADKYVQEIANILAGRSSYIRASDKATEHTLSLNKYGKSQKLAIPLKDLKDGFDSERIGEIFSAYFKAEFKRVGLHRTVGLGKDLDIYNEAGTHFTIFEGIFSAETRKAVNLAIQELGKQDLTTEEITAKLEELAPTFYNAVISDLTSPTDGFLDKYTREILNTLAENNIKIGQGISTELANDNTLEQLIRGVAVNDFINSIEQVKLFIGDMSFYKDLYKRTAAMTGTKQTASTGSDVDSWLNANNKRTDGKTENGKINIVVFEDVNQELNESYLDEYMNTLVASGMSDVEADLILTAYKSMDEGDAQGWITLDELRSFELRMGHWTLAKENLFGKIQAGETLTPEEMVQFTVKKAQYAGPQEYSGLYAPAYHKYSLLPLIPQLVKGKNISLILEHMTKNQIGYALFKSGSKVGTKVNERGRANKFYTDTNNGEINTKDWQKQTIYYDFLGLQTETPAPKEKVIFGTQFRKLLFSNMFEGGKEAFTGNKALLDEYNGIIDELVQTEKARLIKELGIDPKSYKSEDVSKLVELLQKEARDRNLADNLIDGIQSEIIDGKLMLKYKFDAMVNKTKIDSMISSLVNSRLIRQKVNGDALIQVSSSGFESIGKREIGTNDVLKFYRKDPKTGKTLPSEAMVAMNNNYRPLLEEYGILAKLNKAISEGKVSNKSLEFLAYRIPTQGLNSMEYFTIKEFLPEESSTAIILPTAIVAKSGGDYDVDKLNVIRPSLNKDSKTNRIIEIGKEILSHENNFIGLITPNSNKILTSVVDEIRYIEYKNNKPESKLTLAEYTKEYARNIKNIQYTNQLKLTTKIQKFIEFLTAKDMIGMAAVHNTHHILSQQAGLTLNSEYTGKEGEKRLVTINMDHNLTKDGLVDISKISDVNSGNQISEVISQILTSAVDAAKDPFVFVINMNKETLGTYLYLIRTGVPFENIAYFMKQPIISDYLKELTLNSSGFLKAVDNTTYPNQIANQVRQRYRSVINKKDSELTPKTLSTEELKSYLSKANQNTQEYYEVQVQVLNDYLAYKQQGQLLSEAVRATNLDTQGIGGNLEAIARKVKDIQKVKDTGFVKGIDKILEDSLVQSFNQLEFAQKAFFQFYYTQQLEFIKVKEAIYETLQPVGEPNKNKLSGMVENDLISFVIENWGYPNIIDLKNRLFNTESVANKILDLKNKDNKTPHEQAIVDNLLIRELSPILRTKTRAIDNLKIYAKRYDTFTANQLTESFKELMDLDPLLAKEIMDLGILQSGLNNSPITYLGIIPYEYYNDLVKQAFENFDKAEDKSKLDNFPELFLQNNSKDPIVAKVLDKMPLPSLGYGIYGKQYVTTTPTKETKKEPVKKVTESSVDLSVEDEYVPESSVSEEESEIQEQRESIIENLPGPIEQSLDRILADLESRFGIPFEYDYNMSNLGEVRNGIVYINPKLAKADTPFHEYSHIFVALIKQERPELYAKLVAEAKTVKIFDKEQTIFEFVQSKYANKSVEDQEEESVVTVIGLYANEFNVIKKSRTLGELIKDFFNTVKELIAQLTGTTSTDTLNENTTLFDLGILMSSSRKVDVNTRAFREQKAEFIEEYSANKGKPTTEAGFKDMMSRATKNTKYDKLNFRLSNGKIIVTEKPVKSDKVYEQKESVEKPKVDQDSPYKAQIIFFNRRIKDLEKQQSKLTEGTPAYNKLQEEIDSLSESMGEESNKETFLNLGTETLAKTEEYIEKLESGETEVSTEEERRIRYANDVIKIFDEDEDLSNKSKELRRRLFPFINKLANILINDHKTESFEITQEMIDAQNQDIGSFRKGTGSLSDLDNYIGRTIGLIIKSAQNKVSTHRKQLRTEIQAEIDSLLAWGKKNGVSLDKTYDIFIQTHKGTLILTKPFLEDGTANPNYDKIQNTPELKKFYDFYQTKIDEANTNLPFKVSRNFIPNINRKDVKSTFVNLINVKSSVEGDFVGNEDLYADVVHQKYISKLDSDKKSRNLGDSLLTFGTHAKNYEEMSEVLPQARLLEEQLKYKLNTEGQVVPREFIKSSEPNKQIKGEDSNIAKMAHDVIEMQVKDKMKMAQGNIKTGDVFDDNGKVVGEKYVQASELADLALKYNSMLRIGFSPITATANVLFGDVSNIIEAVGGRFFTLGNLHDATKIFGKQVFDKDSELVKWLEKLNPLQELDDYDGISAEGVGKKMSVEKLQEYMYSMQKNGEKFLQSRTMLAVLIKEGYMTPSGETTEKGKNISEKEATQLSDKIQRLNQMIHGRYSSREAATWSQNVAYRLASQFRKWLPAAIEARFGERQYDVRLGVEIEGRYRTFADLIFTKDVMSNLNKLVKGELSELEMYNMRKMLVELTLWAAATFLYLALKGGDDDKDRRKLATVKTALTLLNRVSGDIEFFYSPSQAVNLSKNAIPLGKTVGDLISTINNIPHAFYIDRTLDHPLTDSNSEFERGSRKGLNKFYSKLGNVIPVTKPIGDIIRIGSDNALEELK